MEEAIKIEHIILKVKDVDLKLTTKEAAELMRVLKELFDETAQIYPTLVPYPIYVRPWWEWRGGYWTSSAQVTTAGIEGEGTVVLCSNTSNG